MVVPQRDPVGGLEKTHEETKAVQAEIVRASDQAGVIGAVLAQALPGQAQVGDVAQAIEQTEELEHKLAESAAALADVSAQLGREVKKRRQVAEKLHKNQVPVERLSGAKTKKAAP